MSEEHKQRTREMIKVMQAYVDGRQIEVNHPHLPKWRGAEAPAWDFSRCEYRIATTPDSIDWSHVAPEWKYMARDQSGVAWLVSGKPTRRESTWSNGCMSSRADTFASYKRGTVDWKDSLVERPAQ